MDLPGCMFRRGSRWYWKGRLAGETKARIHSLKPTGARYATTDRRTAEQIVKRLIRAAAITAGEQEPPDPTRLTIAGLVAWYRGWCADYYRGPIPSGLALSLNTLLETSAELRVDEFDAVRLDVVRQAMVSAKLARITINQRVDKLRLMFRRGEAAGLVARGTWEHLRSLEPLRAGHTTAEESVPVRPVDEGAVEAVLPFCPAPIAAMLRLQLSTGMRPGEVRRIRPADVTQVKTSLGEVWVYAPAQHKTAYRGKRRVILIGPRGQAALSPWLTRDPERYCFDPREAPSSAGYAARQDHYCRHRYPEAVARACRAARASGVQVETFGPAQIRHTIATKLDGLLGERTAAEMLGHSSPKTTLKHYIERNLSRALQAALEHG